MKTFLIRHTKALAEYFIRLVKPLAWISTRKSSTKSWAVFEGHYRSLNVALFHQGTGAEMMAEKVEGTLCVTESADSNLRDGLVLDEISAEGFILVLFWLIRFKKESTNVTYVFKCSYRHSCNFLHNHFMCQWRNIDSGGTNGIIASVYGTITLITKILYKTLL